MYDCGVEPQYFLDEMTPSEVGYLAKAHYNSYKERWEMLRLHNHAVIASQSTKPLKAEDIMKFPWDDRRNDKKVMTEEELEAARNRIKEKFNLK